MTMRVLMVGAAGAAMLALAACGGVKESVRDDFCERLGAAKVDGKECKCYVKAVQDVAGGKSESIMLAQIGDLSRDEREQVEKDVKSLTGAQSEKIQEGLQECREDD
jgi:hypothetical protein